MFEVLVPQKNGVPSVCPSLCILYTHVYIYMCILYTCGFQDVSFHPVNEAPPKHSKLYVNIERERPF